MSIRQRNAHFKDWAAVCNALNVATESEARTALESSDNTFYYYVCYIKSTGEIYTHGKFYAIPYDDTELRELIETIQTDIEDFQLVTGTALTQLNNEINDNEVVTAQALSDLNNNKANVSDIPTNVSELTNDSNYVTSTELDAKGYLTEHQDISNLATKTEVNSLSEVVDNKANTSDIPTKMSDLENDSNYLKSTATDAGTLLVDGGPYAFNNLVVSTDGSINDGGCVISSNGDILTSGAIVSPSYGFSLTDKLIFADNAVKLTTNDSTRTLATTDDIPTADTVANWGFVTSNDFANELLNSTRLSFYCVEPVDVVLNGETLTYEANSNVDMTISLDDTFEIVPTSDNSITALTAYPGALDTFYSWLEGVSIFSNIVFDMNDVAMYEKWNQGHQGQYHVQMAQYTNCIFWSDNPYISEINTRTNYTLYNSSQLPLCYSSIPANTFKTFYCAYGVTNDPNWSSSAYKESFAAATWATQVFSYYGMQTIGVYDQDSPKFNITLPKDCRGLMFAAASIENAGVFDAINTTNFGAKSGSWRDAFAYCYALTNLYIKNLKVSINISWSPINQSSLAFIIENAANTSAIKISLSPHTYYQLTDDNKTNAAAKNITLELITANASQDSRLAWLINNGDGTKFLSDTGEYITPNYPSKVSQLENDSGFLTELPENLVTKTPVGELSCINISALEGTNDSLIYALPGNSTGDEDYILVSNVELNEKQDKLISGTNIKTINGQSIIGTGDIPILTTDDLAAVATSGSYEDLNNKPIYITTFDVLSLYDLALNPNEVGGIQSDNQEITNALAANKIVLVPYAIDDDSVRGYATLVGYVEDLLYFKVITNNFEIIVETPFDAATILGQEVTLRLWGAKQDKLTSGTNIVTARGNSILTSGDLFDPVIIATNISDGRRVRVGECYIYTIPQTTSKSFELAVPDNAWNDSINIIINTSSSITFSSSDETFILWANGTAPTFESDKVYEISFRYTPIGWLGVAASFS